MEAANRVLEARGLRQLTLAELDSESEQDSRNRSASEKDPCGRILRQLAKRRREVMAFSGKQEVVY